MSSKRLHYFGIGCEVIVVTVVFALSFQYFKSQKTVSLVPVSQCGQCTTCEKQFTFGEENHFVDLPLSVHVMSNGAQTSPIQYQHITFMAEWKSCGITPNSKFTFPEFSQDSADMAHFPMNGGTWRDSQLGFHSNDDLHAPNENYVITTIFADANGKFSLDPQKMPSACFQLTCSVFDGFISGGYFSVMEVEKTNYQPGIKTQASMTMTNQTVSANCVGVVFGQVLTYYSSSNSIQQSTDYLCTTENSAINALSSSFSNTLTAYGGTATLFKALEKIHEMGLKNFVLAGAPMA